MATKMHLQLLFIAASALTVLVHGNPLPIDDNSGNEQSSPQSGIAAIDTVAANSNSRAKDIILPRASTVSKRKDLIQIDYKISLCTYTDFNKCVEMVSPDRICQTIPKEKQNGINLQDGIVSFRLGDDPAGKSSSLRHSSHHTHRTN